MVNQPYNIDLLVDTQIKEIKRQARGNPKTRPAKKAKKQEPCD